MGWAQAPGYLGRKTLLSSSLDLSPAIRIASRRDIPPFLFNVRLNFDAEQVLSRRFSIGASLNPLLTGAEYDFEGKEGFTTIHGLGAGINCRLYSYRRTGNIAPLGPYSKVGVFYLSYWLKDRDPVFYPDKRRWLGQYNDLGVALEFGNQRVFGKHFYYYYAIRFSTVFGIFDRNRSREEAYLKRVASDRIQGHFFLNARLGVGMLLF